MAKDGTSFSAIATAGEKVIDIADKLGIIDAVKAKLITKPDDAAAKLAAALIEVQKSLIIFEGKAVGFLAITLEAGPNLPDDRRKLLRLEGQSLSPRMDEGYGHCVKITNIYDKYLNPWFQRVSKLNRSERERLDLLFKALGDADNDLFEYLRKASDWLAQEARAVLDLYDAGKTAEAKAKITASRAKLGPVRIRASRLLGVLRKLEAKFVALAKIT